MQRSQTIKGFLIVIFSILTSDLLAQDTAKFNYLPIYPNSTRKLYATVVDFYEAISYRSLIGESYNIHESEFGYDSRSSTWDYISFFKFFYYPENKRLMINSEYIKDTRLRDDLKDDYYIAYDFSLKQGDTLFHGESIDSSCNKLYSIIDSVNYTLIGGTYHRTQHLSMPLEIRYCYGSLPMNYIVIEGFGIPGWPINYLGNYFEYSEGVRNYCIPQLNIDTTIRIYNEDLLLDCDFLSVNELIHSKSKVSIYPNPSSGLVYIKSDQKIKKANIYNQLGNEVFNEIIDKTEINLNLVHLSKGLYTIVLLTSDNSTIHKKLIID